MKDKNVRNNDMTSELFISSRVNTEFCIPPYSKEDYLKKLESETNADEKTKSLEALIQIYRSKTVKNGGKYSNAVCGKMISILHKHGLNPALTERVACMLLKEGAYCEKLRDYQNALRFYESSLPFDLKAQESRYFRLNNLAFCLNFLRRFEEAETFLRSAVEIEPLFYNAWKNLGVSLEHQGQFEESAECYLKAITLSDGEERSVKHLIRLVERYPVLEKVPAVTEFFK